MSQDTHRTSIPENCDVRDYYGNWVYRDGTIINKNGIKLKPYKGKVSIVKEQVDEKGETIRKRHSILHAKVVYEAFTGQTVPRTMIVRYRDENPENVNINNIAFVSKKEYFRDYDWSPLKKLSDDTVQEIRHIYRVGETNRGNLKNQLNREVPSQYELSKQYEVSLSTIQKIVKGVY